MTSRSYGIAVLWVLRDLDIYGHRRKRFTIKRRVRQSLLHDAFIKDAVRPLFVLRLDLEKSFFYFVKMGSLRWAIGETRIDENRQVSFESRVDLRLAALGDCEYQIFKTTSLERALA